MLQEMKSRLAACTRFDLVNINRYTCAMSEHGVETHHWRKGAQWLSLLRSHAQVLPLLLTAALRASKYFRQHYFFHWDIGTRKGGVTGYPD